MVEPGHPFQRFPLQAVYAFPWPSLVDQFGLVEAIDGLCQCVVVAITGVANRRFDTGLTQPFAVANRQILRAPVAVMNQPVRLRPTGVKRLLERIQDKLRAHVPTDTPADDEPRVDIHDERDVGKSLPG